MSRAVNNMPESLRCHRLLLTGAAGNLGLVLRPRLKAHADILRVSDVAAMAVLTDFGTKMWLRMCRMPEPETAGLRRLSITHISYGGFASIESSVILSVTPIRGGVTDEWRHWRRYERLA